ncbi:hypothetical protein CERSUDRAFT_163525 [Gelatoporia subvermispora B]|uniref:Methyltransferase n=1 Tax=Ceriporiopsis subvermispora (strain B) TaxID=914234 RepID=M2QX42_CERS8|nr:hypothetical protein CERSUDRAFT_163525 [Gelatoporia subvermispora B]
MATATVLTPGDVPTSLNYYAPIGEERPYNYAYEAPQGIPKSNVGTDPHPAVIHDVRGKEDTVSLDTTGFQFTKHVSEEKDFLDEELIKTRYYKEVEELLKKEVGAKRVFIFDHIIRRKPGGNGNDPARGPALLVHIDQTFEASVNRVHYHLGDEAERLLKGRVRIINVWRPIGNPVYHKPLAVADWRTLDKENDLVPVRLIYPHREGATFSVRYNPDHRWYYLSNQTPDEVLFIKCYDSEEDKARLTPHTAFPDSTSPEDAPQRESIEVRTLVFDTE